MSYYFIEMLFQQGLVNFPVRTALTRIGKIHFSKTCTVKFKNLIKKINPSHFNIYKIADNFIVPSQESQPRTSMKGLILGVILSNIYFGFKILIVSFKYLTRISNQRISEKCLVRFSCLHIYLKYFARICNQQISQKRLGRI